MPVAGPGRMSAPADQTNAIAIAALDLPVAERAAFLDQACGDDAPLRQLVEALIRAHQFAPTLGRLGSPGRKPTGALSMPVSEKPGDKIGPFKLLQQIGVGAFGVVYMAEQEQPVRRRVALKVIKLGMDTKQVIARFEAERQALALMDHPNIAKVLDAGATDAGRPYFVMELVRGVKITDYCDQGNVPTHQRLELFMQVCRAIQHAHQKGIIHRDIKPSNILVTLHDGVPVPKVIDFGIAKAIEQKLTDKTLFTELNQFIGTPAYMSPEQAELSGLDIDTRSDIYSLGVLLYELLTGQMPFDPKALRVAGLDEMRRIIREHDPVKPSTKLSSLTAADQTSVARQRQVEALKLIHLVRGDLDWIAMKCLEKDRARRYETANGLVADIRRHLDNEPVVARPPSQLYQFSKLVRRNKLLFASVGAVAAALILGLGLSTFLFIQETREHDLAMREAKKSEEVARFLSDMLEGVGPSVALGRDTRLLREILDKTADRVAEELKAQPELEANLLTTIGEVYRALEVYDKAEAMHRKALTIRTRLWGERNADVATSKDALGMALFSQTKLAEAEALYSGALTIRTQLFGADHPAVAASLDNVAVLLQAQGQLPEAETVHRKVLALRRKFTDNRPELAEALIHLASALWRQKQPKGLEEAETLNAEAMAILRRQFGEFHPGLATAMLNQATVFQAEGKQKEAEAMYSATLDLLKRLQAEESATMAQTLDNFGMMLSSQGKLPEGETMLRRALELRRRVLGDRHEDYAQSLNNLAVVLQWGGNLAGAEKFQREYLARTIELHTSNHLYVVVAKNNLAWVLRDQGKLPEAELLLREALTLQRNLVGATNADFAFSLHNLGALCNDQGKFAEAEQAHREALAIRRLVLGNEDPKVGGSLVLLATTLCDAGKPAEAESFARSGWDIFHRKQPDDWRAYNAQAVLGRSLAGQTNYLAAEPLLLSGCLGLEQRLAAMPAAAKPYYAQALRSLIQLYKAWDKPEPAEQWRAKLGPPGAEPTKQK